MAELDDFTKDLFDVGYQVHIHLGTGSPYALDGMKIRASIKQFLDLECQGWMPLYGNMDLSKITAGYLKIRSMEFSAEDLWNKIGIKPSIYLGSSYLSVWDQYSSGGLDFYWTNSNGIFRQLNEN